MVGGREANGGMDAVCGVRGGIADGVSELLVVSWSCSVLCKVLLEPCCAWAVGCDLDETAELDLLDMFVCWTVPVGRAQGKWLVGVWACYAD